MTNWTISTKLFTLAAIGQQDAVDTALDRYYESEIPPRLEAAGQNRRGTDLYVPALRAARALQAMYIADNPDPVGSKHLLDAAALLSSMAVGSSMSEEKMRVMKGRGTSRCP
jgi:hypothetical protein